MPSTITSASDTATADIHPLDAVRERRHYIILANAHWAWQEIKARGRWRACMSPTIRQAGRAGSMIAGEVSYVEVAEELRQLYG